MWTLWLALACATAPQTIAECTQITDVGEREACRWDFIQPLKDDPKAVEAALKDVDEAGSRDLVRLRLAIDSPQTTGRYCRKVETRSAQDKCRQVLGRPHLSTQPKPPQAPR